MDVMHDVSAMCACMLQVIGQRFVKVKNLLNGTMDLYKIRHNGLIHQGLCAFIYVEFSESLHL